MTVSSLSSTVYHPKSLTQPKAGRAQAVGQNQLPLFGKAAVSADETRIRAQAQKMIQAEKPLLTRTMLKLSLLSLFSFLLPASIMPRLMRPSRINQLYQSFKESAQAQAEFNATSNLDVLNPYLSYRNLLSQQHKFQELAQYDQVLNRIVKEAEFYETHHPSKIQKKLKSSWHTTDYIKKSRLLGGNDFILSKLWKFLSDRNYRQSLQAEAFQLQAPYLAKLETSKLTEVFKNVTPLSAEDKATRYLVAGQIADLLYKKPQYLDKILKTETGYPLRFLITKNSPTLVAGSYLNGLNVITLNKTLLWLPPCRTTAQHEFIHATSAQQGIISDRLSYMSAEQQKRFEKARHWLVEQHEQKGSSWIGKLKHWWSGKTVTGIRNYSFFNAILTIR